MGLVTAAASGSFQLGTTRSPGLSVTGPGSGSRVVSSGTSADVSGRSPATEVKAVIMPDSRSTRPGPPRPRRG